MSHGVERAHVPAAGPRWLSLVFWLLLVAAVALFGSWTTLPQIATWYATIAKPSFTPPNAVFGPVWTVLYLMMAVAAWRVGPLTDGNRRRAITLFGIQLAFNAVWSPVFFGLEAPRAGLAIILALLISLSATLVAFWRLDRPAALLLVPYLAWVCYATALNAEIVRLN